MGRSFGTKTLLLVIEGISECTRLSSVGRVTTTSGVVGTYQTGGLPEYASVLVSLHVLSVHDEKDFTDTLYPSTFKGRVLSLMAEESYWSAWVKLKDGLNVETIPRAFLSAKTITVSRLMGSLAFETLLG